MPRARGRVKLADPNVAAAWSAPRHDVESPPRLRLQEAQAELVSIRFTSRKGVSQIGRDAISEIQPVSIRFTSRKGVSLGVKSDLTADKESQSASHRGRASARRERAARCGRHKLISIRFTSRKGVSPFRMDNTMQQSSLNPLHIAEGRQPGQHHRKENGMGLNPLHIAEGRQPRFGRATGSSPVLASLNPLHIAEGRQPSGFHAFDSMSCNRVSIRFTSRKGVSPVAPAASVCCWSQSASHRGRASASCAPDFHRPIGSQSASHRGRASALREHCLPDWQWSLNPLHIAEGRQPKQSRGVRRPATQSRA